MSGRHVNYVIERAMYVIGGDDSTERGSNRDKQGRRTTIRGMRATMTVCATMSGGNKGIVVKRSVTGLQKRAKRAK